MILLAILNFLLFQVAFLPEMVILVLIKTYFKKKYLKEIIKDVVVSLCYKLLLCLTIMIRT